MQSSIAVVCARCQWLKTVLLLCHYDKKTALNVIPSKKVLWLSSGVLYYIVELEP